MQFYYNLFFIIQDYARALESMKEAEMWMKYSTLSETKSVSFKKDIAKQIEFLSEKVKYSEYSIYIFYYIFMILPY